VVVAALVVPGAVLGVPGAVLGVRGAVLGAPDLAGLRFRLVSVATPAYSVFTAWPPNWLRSAASTLAE
jgi:hypothetical protein